jgi:hypothetical protein
LWRFIRLFGHRLALKGRNPTIKSVDLTDGLEKCVSYEFGART